MLHDDENEQLALFHCHLSVEKSLKALYVYENDTAPPLTHDLSVLASSLKDAEVRQAFDDLKIMSKFAVAARYDDMDVLEEEIVPVRVEHWLSFSRSLLNHAEHRA